MAERTLILRCASSLPYFMLATDFPSARVFNVTSSQLACVVELPVRSRSSLAAVRLTSIAIGSAGDGQRRSRRGGGGQDAELGATHLAVAGLSDGTVLIRSVEKDEPVAHISVSATQHAVIAMCMTDGFLFCLTANHTLTVHDVSALRSAGDRTGTLAGALLSVRVQIDASAIAVCAEDEASGKNDSAAAGVCAFRVLVAGPTHVLLRVQLSRALPDAAADAEGHAAAASVARGRSTSEKLLSFSSQASAVDYAWIGYVPAAAADEKSGSATSAAPVLAALTASAQEGAIHVWDMTSSAVASPSSLVAARGRRTLVCGQRIANFSALMIGSRAADGSGRGDGRTRDFSVLASTFTGSVLLWSLGATLLPRVAEPAPLAPTTAFFSSTPSARLLYGVLLPAAAGAATPSRAPGVDILFLRGRFAMPSFELASAQRLVDEHDARLRSATAHKGERAAMQKRVKRAASSLGLGISPSLTVVELPPSGADAARGANVPSGDARDAFVVLDTAWASQQRRVNAQMALATPTESFAAAHAVHAASMKELPTKQLTLEQRLKALSAKVADEARRDAAAAAADVDEHAADVNDDNGDDGRVGLYPSLGLATVPLYQALHASDASAVMELLSVAHRSAAGVRATALSLRLPYVLQLIGTISQRLGIVSSKTTRSATAASPVVAGGGGGLSSVSCRSPLIHWLNALLHYRGAELYAAQLLSATEREAAAEKEKQREASMTTTAATTTAAAAAATVSPPKDFVAPILHQYRSMCSNYDKLAALYGRLSVFNAVRPSERDQFVNRPRKMLSSNRELARTPAAESGKLHAEHTVLDDDLLFPAMFTELRTSKGPHVVRVKSKLARDKALRAQTTSDRALLRRARQLARASRKDEKKAADDAISDDDAAAGDDELDLAAMEAMGLDSSDGGEGDLSGSEDEHDAEENEDGAPRSKRTRGDVTRAEMLADAPSSLEHTSNDEDESGADGDADLDSEHGDVEFARESDDDVDSDVLGFSDEDRKKRRGNDEESSSSSSSADEESSDGDEDDAAERRAGRGTRSDSDSGGDDDDDDGMGEDMTELLESMDQTHSTAEGKREARKGKRVRTD